MEHLDQVLLDTALNDLSLLPWVAIDDLGQLASALWGVLREESLPLFLLREVEVHEDGVVRLLDVHVDVRVADDGVNLGQGAHRIIYPDLQVAACADCAAAECLLLSNVLVVVALTAEWVPQLEAAIRNRLLAHHKDHFSVRHTGAEHNEGHEGFVLLLVDVGEVVSKQDGMLLEIAATQVEELLRGAEQIWVLLAKHVQVLDVGDHGDESGCSLNSIAIARISIQVNYLFWRLLRCEVSADENAHTADVLSEELDVLILELALRAPFVEPLGAII